MRTECFIAGPWRPASDGGRIPVVDQATGEQFADVPDGTVEDGLAADGLLAFPETKYLALAW